MSLTKISCSIANSDPVTSLGLEIWLGNQKILNQEHVQESLVFEHEFSDDKAEHELRFVMKNKTPDHTKIDSVGNIEKDACLVINDVTFNEIPLGQILIEQAVYVHDFNGSGDQIKDQFFGIMGCNGTVSLKFSTPIYLWLLENM